MNHVRFAEEFSLFLRRWMTPVTNEDGTSAPLLTNQQIASAIHNVEQVLLGVNLAMPDYSSVKTPATGIAVCTPSAPMIQKSSLDTPNTSLGRYRSLDTLMAEDKDAATKVEELASKSQEEMDIDENTGNETTIEEMKFISRSSPAIHVTKIGKSDTFIREEEKAKVDADQTISNTFIEADASANELQRILKKFDELRDCASNVVSRIDDVKKEVCPQSTKPIRRLSSIGGFPGLGRTSTLIRPMPPTKLRRSSAGIPGTPTSSKLNSGMKVEKSTICTRRSISVTSTVRSPNATIQQPKNRSPSTTTTVLMKKSPITTKNPKYAHVQSTIPKPTTTKRKAQ
ncbi:uncharacterized protein LOC143211368 [Lasioglossum baleicum]|uniref:uncharacterized protein LOC143211368 n=1 Tax=Lasioglossum baleicum TaxID=434251 RepID=UPI003FCE32CA